MTKKNEHPIVIERARPMPVQQSKELQHYGTVSRLPIALDAAVCECRSVARLRRPRRGQCGSKCLVFPRWRT